MLKHMDLETASIAAKNGIDPFHVAVKKVISVKEHSDVSNGNSRTLFYRITCFDTYLGCACRHIEDLLDVFGSGHENRFFLLCAMHCIKRLSKHVMVILIYLRWLKTMVNRLFVLQRGWGTSKLSSELFHRPVHLVKNC